MIAVVIPAYKVKKQILQVVNGLDKTVSKIIVVDDQCPEQSGKYLEENFYDDRLEVIYHQVNQGVGGAVVSGYKRSLELGAEIVVKMDGDGQMDVHYMNSLITPLLENKADYTKGNRFYGVSFVKQMPTIRLLGNSCLSIINKFVNGYWSVMDPTNGYTAISKKALKQLDFNKLNRRYFFESDMLFRLSIQRSIVMDVPIPAKYEEEESSLSIRKVLFSFPPKYINRFFKRIFYLYCLRDFNAGSIQLFIGLIFFLFGVVFGSIRWLESIQTNDPATAGTIMLASLPIILGFQLLLGFLYFDVNNQPKKR